MRSFFVPILAGGTLSGRLVACLGACIGIALTSVISAALVDPHGSLLLIVAPMGAAAVLIFAVPASPLAQPWPVIGGNVISALVGVAVAKLVPIPILAAGIAVGGAILAMSLTRSLHPPAGAAALSAVVGGPVVMNAGFGFALVPIAVNAVVLVVLGVAFHKASGHSYPHRSLPVTEPTPQADDAMLTREDLDLALVDLDETYDVGREDLDALLRRVEYHALRRRTLATRDARR
jgi:CBS domain-containing membrane protein